MATVIQGEYSNVETICYHYLMNNGYTLAQTCGILANINKESSFNPTSYNKNEGAYGLCQWRKGRRNNLHTLYGDNPDVKSQLSFMDYEMKKGEKKVAGEAFRAVTSNTLQGARDAAYVFASKYEICHKSHYDARVELANKYWNLYSGVSTVYPVPGGDVSFIDPLSYSKAPAYISLSSTNQYIEESMVFSRVEAEGYDYGYLIDMTNGGEFKFYVPEFSESAGAIWGKIDIPGRSVDIKTYQSTTSRSISIDLDLFAGAGLYISDDPVSQLHTDANFLKSLEYPDYSDSIMTPPPTVCLILGSAISITGVVSSVSVKHQKPLDAQNRAMYLQVSFTVTQTSPNPPDFHDIRNGQYSIPNTEDLNSLSNPTRKVQKGTGGRNGMPSDVSQREKEYYK